ncbi:MAG: molybdopterin molybdotransferase MoeA [Rhodospirillaceae bacterium]|nr:molybdopterin molybdotransferase MoeA [Rhodospirillaceae bacterium]MBT4939125.1 molybdopterin molybdotransferase MoeA [Rhodospirillaceae bacterium]MBT5938523.1 molybdopterin molybdotransferase MoeA [Rhodospirillaceae bacterium]MBT7265843.1 molybdopterin molybdotransferase MoeA [Rhodospirillaceae bacterium]
MIAVEDALKNVLAGVKQLGTEDISVADAQNRVLAADVISRLTQPPVAVSAMDGYAVRAEDVASVPATLTQIGESAAGSGFDGKIEAGQTTRIFTGAPVPEGADAIVIQEDTETAGDQITMIEAAPAGKYIRPAGLDFKTGDTLLSAGTRLNSRNIALAAAMNVPWIKVYRRPRVAILSTGDELVLPGEPVGPDQIISSNSIGMAAFVTANGGVPINLGIAKDDPDSLKEMLNSLSGADMLVTIGGASVGDHDLVKSVLGEEGLDITFSRVAMRPGKPLIFGQISGIPMLGLPGNPVSAGVTAALFLRPAINKMMGLGDSSHRTETAILGRDLDSNDKRQDYLRSTLDIDANGALTAIPFDRQDSSMLARFAQAQCLVVRVPFAEPISAGERVEIIKLDGSF